MRITFLITIIGIALFSSITGCEQSHSRSQPASEAHFSKNDVATLDSFVVKLQQSLPLPGVAIAIVKNNATYFKAIGKSQLSIGLPFTDSTVFFTGNFSELMVATSVLTLAKSGKISLDDPVVKHLPYFKLVGDTYRGITIRHLLTHTSGIPYHDVTWDLPEYHEHALESTTRSISLQEPLFNSGSLVKRSPYNYDILADLIAHASGTSFEEYTKQNVLPQLNMKKSTFYMADLTKSTIASPHEINDWLTYSMTETELYPYNREHAGSIGFHTTVSDITSWMYTMLHEGNGLWNEKLFKEFLEPQYKTGNSYYIGLGWEIEKLNDEFIYKKTHQMGGFSGDITLIPEKNIGVFVTSNTGNEFSPSTISSQIIAYLNNNKPLTLKVPIHIAMTKELFTKGSLDSALQFYIHEKKTHPNEFDFGVESLSQLGVNLLYRLDNPEQAKRVFQFCIDQYKESAYAHLNLVEAYLLNDEPEKAKEALAVVKQLPSDHRDIEARVQYIEEALVINAEKENLDDTN